jgi:hypothetical protein
VTVPGYLALARQALARTAAEPSADRADREVSELSELTPAAWDQAEAEHLLGHLRRELTRLERTWPGGKFPPVTANVVGIFTEVCESYVRDHELEAARGWDALALLRAAVARALDLATPSTPRRTA